MASIWMKGSVNVVPEVLSSMATKTGTMSTKGTVKASWAVVIWFWPTH